MPKESGNLGSLSAGLHDDCPSDDYGPYITYTGGEMSMGYEIGSSGKIRESGIGILLFLDGQPQPYRLEGESTYTYLHTFYPEKPLRHYRNFRQGGKGFRQQRRRFRQLIERRNGRGA